MTNQPRPPLDNDVSERARWEVHPDGGEPPINPSRRDSNAATLAATVGAQDRPWRDLLNSAPMAGPWPPDGFPGPDGLPSP
jgi:hypothetical protein